MGRHESTATKRDGMTDEYPRPDGTVRQECIAGTSSNCEKLFMAAVTIFPNGGKDWNRICPKCTLVNQQLETVGLGRRKYGSGRKPVPKKWWSSLVAS